MKNKTQTLLIHMSFTGRKKGVNLESLTAFFSVVPHEEQNKGIL